MIKDCNKIVIIGGPGTGKTTLAKDLSSILNINFYSLDDIRFKKDWQPRKKSDINKKISYIFSQEKWIIEGNHFQNLELILEQCELVVFLDFRLSLQLFGILKRFFTNLKSPKSKKYKSKIRLIFLIKTLLYNIRKKPKIIDLLMNKNKYKLVLLNNHHQVAKWTGIIRNS